MQGYGPSHEGVESPAERSSADPDSGGLPAPIPVSPDIFEHAGLTYLNFMIIGVGAWIER
jgi:hypothetical protein